jgi:beta-lactamase superfamily II metal-dependent hydrolase
MIKRIFHPIGQGAFYSERHDNFTIVYDCGNSSRGLTSPVVAQAFNKKDDIINILFISHFDWDHISKIKALEDHTKKIERVVMPYLHDNEKILLSNIYNAMGESESAILVSKPENYFRKGTEITYVRSADENDQNNNNEPIPIEKLSKKINSSTPILIHLDEDWIYIPYNNCYKERNNTLTNELKKKGFDVDQLIKDPQYALDQITTMDQKNKIKEIYKKFDGNINQNSMMLYSGPKNYNHFYFLNNSNKPSNFSITNFNHYYLKDQRVACIYTGDADLNVSDIRTIFIDFWYNVGTIQIPHHGAITSFNAKILQNGNFFCPISFGKYNIYGHPSSKVLGDILANNSSPIYVTGDLDSTFIQIIKSDLLLMRYLKIQNLCK